MREKIFQELSTCKTEADFADKIFSIGEQYLHSGELDSDELVWEVAREIWRDQNKPENFEIQVSDIYHKFLE
tara:strand:- start:364 stop:579 length:216 start_codon:yes stop_codon:yes gene_type:complete